MPESLQDAQEILIPRTAIEPLTQFVSNAGDRPIGVAPGEKYIAFCVGNRSLLVRRLEGRFPNYEAAMDIGKGREVVVPRRPLAEALQHTMQFADARKGTIRVRVQDGQVQLLAASSEFGEAKEVIPVDFKAEPYDAFFNMSYLREFLDAVETSPSVTLSMIGSNSTLMLQPIENSPQFEYKYLVMPCRGN
jgi:DNA polymerase-3 subunit beta